VRRGNLIHDVLSRTVYIEEGWRARLEAALREGGEEAHDAAETAAAAERLFSTPPLSGLFSPAEGRRVLNEFTVCDAAGRALRMDRVVLDPGAATVIDYKTGGSPVGERPETESLGGGKQGEGLVGGKRPGGESSGGVQSGGESLGGEKQVGGSVGGKSPDAGGEGGAEEGDAAGGGAAAIAPERREERIAAVRQVREYMRILRELYPERTVRGLLVWIDRGDVEEVA